MTRRDSIWKSLDWVTIVVYLLLIVFGWFSVCGASYDYGDRDFLDFSTRAGKQFVWIICSFGLGFVLLMLDDSLYDMFSYLIYIGLMLLLIVTIFIAPDTKGSRSWLILGPVSLQPAEFAKFATALALAKLFSGYNFVLRGSQSYYKALTIIFVPILLILAQHETGSALAYLSLFFVLYREGMSGLVLLAAACAVVFFVVAVKFSEPLFMGIPSGEAVVLGLIMILMVLMVAVYCRRPIEARNILFGFIATTVVVSILALCGISVPGYLFFIGSIVVACGYIGFTMLRAPAKRLMLTLSSTIVAVVFLFSVNFTFNSILQPHQQMRIKVALGIENDPRGVGYNVNQSKIAIGSGGFWGKGFLNGTQTKLKYVPEQHTDFIFCTIGEEQGFVGATAVVLLFLALILRILSLAERQPTVFGRVYAYCVASFLMFHLAINVGMVIGLCPVIGIPLPFFSYGGSSLWGFTFLLFILLRIDAARRERPGL